VQVPKPEGLSNSTVDSDYGTWTIEHKNYHLAQHSVR
jgi:hypothetical protein